MAEPTPLQLKLLITALERRVEVLERFARATQTHADAQDNLIRLLCATSKFTRRKSTPSQTHEPVAGRRRVPLAGLYQYDRED